MYTPSVEQKLHRVSESEPGLHYFRRLGPGQDQALFLSFLHTGSTARADTDVILHSMVCEFAAIYIVQLSYNLVYSILEININNLAC